MQIDFYAAQDDKLAMLDLIFSQTEYRVFDHYSPYGQELREYRSSEEVANTYNLSNGTNLVQLALWNPAFGDAFIARRVELNPKYCNGHTFRYAASGWSLQQLYLNGIALDTLHPSKLQGFTQKGALAKDHADSVNPTKAASLNWPQIQQSQKALKAFLLKALQARKEGSYLILPQADRALQAGNIKLAY